MFTRKLIVVSGAAVLTCLSLVLSGASLTGCGSTCAEADCNPPATGGSAGSGGSTGTGGGGTGGGGGSSGTDGGSSIAHQMVNGCDPMTAVDKRAEAMVQVNFPGLAYDPPCIRVMEGTIVTFSGDFATHPLVGGKVAGTTPTADSMSPVPMTSSGMSATATFSKAGDHGYYCSRHFASNMMGAVYVDAPRPPTSR